MENSSVKRRGLKVVQPSASSGNVIVGNDRPKLETKKKNRSSFHVYEEKDSLTSRRIERCDKGVNTTATTTSVESHITAADLTAEVPSENYWKDMAEARRLALSSALEENKQLHEQVDGLKLRVSELEEKEKSHDELAERADELAEIVKSLVEQAESDTKSDVDDPDGSGDDNPPC